MEVTKQYQTTDTNVGHVILHFYCQKKPFSSVVLLLLLQKVKEKIGKWHIWLAKLMK
jgi:hypothetical protein